jgi:hypothetical protein
MDYGKYIGREKNAKVVWMFSTYTVFIILTVIRVFEMNKRKFTTKRLAYSFY